MRTNRIIGGGVALVVGVVLLLIGLSPEMSCSVITAFGGHCVVFFGRLGASGGYAAIPAILDGLGLVLIALGAILAALGARK